MTVQEAVDELNYYILDMLCRDTNLEVIEPDFCYSAYQAVLNSSLGSGDTKKKALKRANAALYNILQQYQHFLIGDIPSVEDQTILEQIFLDLILKVQSRFE